MTPTLRRRTDENPKPLALTAAAVAACVAVCVSAVHGRALPTTQAIELSQLTVPASRLTDGCGLETVASSDGHSKTDVVRPWLHPPDVVANPWIGTDARVVAWIRGHVDPPIAFSPPDGPPVTAREDTELTMRLADGVVDAYVATYREAQFDDFSVQAVRFTADARRFSDPVMSSLEMKRSVPGSLDARQMTVVDAGRVRAVLYANPSPCSRAVASYLHSLGK
jgi:hypothetical protein